MAKTVVGLFDTFAEAQNVVQHLVDNGFSRNDISLVANDARGEYGKYTEVGERSDAADGAAAGAVGGGVVGGTLGLLVGLGMLAIPGIGPVLAAGPLAAALTSTAVGAGLGAAAGGLIGGLIGAGVPEPDANYYAEGVRRGGTLVTVSASDDMAQTAYSLMQRHGAVDINERGTTWRESGWSNFDPNAEPYDSDAEREWKESSKLGTTGGAVAGAATGAAMGSVGGPIGTVIGGAAGAAVGAGVGAAGDIAGEKAEDTVDRDVNTYRDVPPYESDAEREWRESSKLGTATGTAAGAATGAAMGSVAGPVGTVVGGLAGAAAGAGIGAAGDVAGEKLEGYDTYANDFRSHYQTNYANSGYTYDQYDPVYRYGYGLASDARYRDKDWSLVESSARRDWEERNPGTWERFKDSVRYAWDKARNRY